MQAAEDLHQRALASAVLAQQPLDLTLAQIEIDASERGRAAEPLDHPAQLEDRRGTESGVSESGDGAMVGDSVMDERFLGTLMSPVNEFGCWKAG